MLVITIINNNNNSSLIIKDNNSINNLFLNKFINNQTNNNNYNILKQIFKTNNLSSNHKQINFKMRQHLNIKINQQMPKSPTSKLTQ